MAQTELVLPKSLAECEPLEAIALHGVVVGRDDSGMITVALEGINGPVLWSIVKTARARPRVKISREVFRSAARKIVSRNQV